MKKSIDELLQAPYWIIDILPKQVKKESAGQFFAVEKYYLTEPQLSMIRQKHVNIILKLNCFKDLLFDGQAGINPDPKWISQTMNIQRVNITVDDSLIVSDPDDTYMTVFNPDEGLLGLIKSITAGEGMFLWQPKKQKKTT